VFSVLAQLFVVERHRPRAGKVGFSIPTLGETLGVDSSIEPLLVTNMRGTFVRTHVSKDGCVRYGFSECTLDQEPNLLCEFYRTIIREGEKEGWGNKVDSIPQALEKMIGFGVTPKRLVVPLNFSGAYEGLEVIKSALPEGSALVLSQSENAGNYIRTGDNVAIVAQRVSAQFVVV